MKINNISFKLSKRADFADEVIRDLENKSGKLPQTKDLSGLRPVSDPIIDVSKAYEIFSTLESNKNYIIGDSGTSFGTTQVQFGSFVNQLSRDPQAQSITGISSQQFSRLGKSWNDAKKKVVSVNLWKEVPVDPEKVKQFIKQHSNSIIRRKEATTIRMNPGNTPGIVRIKNGKYIGLELDTNVLKSLGIDINKYYPEIQKITQEFVTDGVVRNAIVRLVMKNLEPELYNKFYNVFSTQNVRKNKQLRNLADRATQRDFMNRIDYLINDVKKYGYDTTAPGAFNIYQLLGISNGSGVGRVRQFLKEKKPFYPGNLHYLQRANRVISKITGIPSDFPTNGGLSGFTNKTASFNKKAEEFFEDEPTKVDVDREVYKVYNDFFNKIKHLLTYQEFRNAIVKKIKFEPKGRMEYLKILDVSISSFINKNREQIISNPEKDLFLDFLNTQWDIILKEASFSISKRAEYSNPGVLYFPGDYANDIKEGKRKMTIRAGDVPAEVNEVVKCISYSGAHICDLLITNKEQMSLNRIEKAFGKRIAQALEQKFGTNRRFFVIKFEVFKNENLADDDPIPEVYFPESEHIFLEKKLRNNKGIYMTLVGKERNRYKEGREYMTPWGHKVKVVSIITLKGLENHPFIDELSEEQKSQIGNNKYELIRLEKIVSEKADDDDENDKKWDEVLIDKDGVKLTRKQIKKHYLKPAIRKEIMLRIKNNPILIYIGTGTNEKILKRNHNNKQIVITNDDPEKDESPNNYFYWIERRLLSIHQVFGQKTDLGFVDLDLHEKFSIEKAKKYANEVSSKIESKFDVRPSTYQSGGTGLHIEFKLKEEKNINVLRSELKDLLDEINKDWDNVTTGIVKGEGMRSDISTLHNKGSLRVPGALGETYGKVKKPISEQSGDDDSFGNTNFGGKYLSIPENLDEDPSGLDTGAIVPKPDLGAAPSDGVGNYNFALSKREKLIKKSIFYPPSLQKEHIWIWDPYNKKIIIHLNYDRDGDFETIFHRDLARQNNIDLDSKGVFRGLIFIFDNNESEIVVYENREELPESLTITLQNFVKKEIDIKEIDFPKHSIGDLWKEKEKARQLENHMEKRRWMGFSDPDPEFLENLKLKFASNKILILVPPIRFDETEYLKVKTALTEKYGFTTNTVSLGEVIKGSNGTIINTDLDISDVNVSDYNSIFIIGGKGMLDFSKNISAHKLIKSFVRNKKPMAMVCYGALLASEAGILKGREISGIDGIENKFGAIYTGAPIERDGNIFTISNIDNIEDLSFIFANFLSNEETSGSKKFFHNKEAQIQNIWKLAGLVEEEEEEWEKLLSKHNTGEEEESEKEDEAEKWLLEHEPSSARAPVHTNETKEEKKSPIKPKSPKRTLYDQIEGEIPEELKTQKKPEKKKIERRKKTKEYEEEVAPKDVSFGDLFGDESPTVETSPEVSSEKSAPISKEQIESIRKVINSEEFENIISGYNKHLDEVGKQFHMSVLNLSPEELLKYLIPENEYEDSDKTLIEEYISQIVNKNDVLQQFPKEKIISEVYKKFDSKEVKEEVKKEIYTGKATGESGEQFAIDDMLEMIEKDTRLIGPSFAPRITPPADEEGKILQSWPKIKVPELSGESLYFFHPDNMSEGPSLRKIFSNPKAWDVLKKNPVLLQNWVLPSLIMAIGHRWFELNSAKEYVGKRTGREGELTFKHLQGGAPFSMLDDVMSPESIKKLQSGEMDISDLPEAKEYIQHINKLITDMTNVYFSKENPLVPIDEYIYKGLQNEMIKIIAKKHGFVRKHMPKCSICLSESDARTEIEAMVLVGKGLYKCNNCERIIYNLKSDLPDLEGEVRLINKKISIYNDAKTRITEDLSETSKKKFEAIIANTEPHLSRFNVRKDIIEKQIKDINDKINIRSAQSKVPYFHTLCPNPSCKLQRIPLTSIDWADQVWNTEEGKTLKENLKKQYQIESPFPEQNAEFKLDVPIPSHIKKTLVPSEKMSWIYFVPFKCPYDGISFKMKDVIGQGYRNMAGFFYYPYEKIIWQSEEEKNKKLLERDPQLDPTNKAPELGDLQIIANRAQKSAQQQYYEFYMYLRMLDVAVKTGQKEFEVGGKIYEAKPLTKKQKSIYARELILYDTIKDFAISDVESYINWLAGSSLTSKPIYEDGVVQNKTTVDRILSYTEKREQIYLPILQKWIDNMMKLSNYMNRFNISNWLVNVGEKQDDGSFSEDGIPSDGPGTYFISQVKQSGDEDNSFYGFSCNLESKRRKDDKYKKQFDKKGPRILRILDVIKIDNKYIQKLTSAQKEGKDAISKALAENIIKTSSESCLPYVKSHDFHQATLKDDVSTLISGDYVLVRAFIIPGKFYWGPILNIQEIEENKRDFEFWQKFYELIRLKQDNPEYWKEFEEKVSNTKPFLYRLEDLIDREIFKAKSKKRANFALSIREAKDPLSTYKKKRDFEETKEPEGKIENKNKHRFVIQDHKADRAGYHFDLRIENDEGTMSSWALPKHKLPEGKEKLLAMKVEDHPISYNKFHGSIPKGEYGAGEVSIYDSGIYEEIEKTSKKIVFKLKGKKEKGTFNLINTDGKKWLITMAKEQEAKDGGSRVLYHIGRRPPKPKPFGDIYSSRPYLKNVPRVGLFLTDNPLSVALNHGKKGNVYSYRIPEWVISEAGGLHTYDSAKEMIISDELWEKAGDKIEFLGKSMEAKELQDKVNMAKRSIVDWKGMKWPRFENIINKLKNGKTFDVWFYSIDNMPEDYVEKFENLLKDVDKDLAIKIEKILSDIEFERKMKEKRNIEFASTNKET